MRIGMIFPLGYTDTDGMDRIAELGFRDAEICTLVFEEDAERALRVLRYGKALGLRLCLHAPYGRNNIGASDRALRARSIAEIKQAIDLAAELELGTVTFHPGRQETEADDPEQVRRTIFDSAAEIARYAKEKRVYVGLENMERRRLEVVMTVEDLNRFAPLCHDNPYFGVTLDYVHFSTHGVTPHPRELLLPIHDIHVSQNANGKTHLPLTVPDGIVNYETVCRSLGEVGYTGNVTLEIKEQHAESLRILSSLVNPGKADP